MRLACLLLAVSCTTPAAPTVLAQAEPTHVDIPIDTKLSPLTGEWMEKQGEISFTPPLGATEARPLVVALHGAGDRPEWSCAEWREITGGHALIACPHGGPFGNAYAWTSMAEIEQRALAAEADARAKYGVYVDPGPPLLVAFSQGARLASILARKHPEHWPVVVLLEGGYDETKWAFGPAFAKGGKRILFACSTYDCAKGYADAARSMAAAKVDGRIADFGNLGHHMGLSVRERMRAELRWVVRDDERWEAWLESP
jgi:pimeloyl-ACP methyl ester carboxylesterase